MWTGILIEEKGSLFKNCLVSLDCINNLQNIYLCYAMEGIIYCQPLATRLKILLNVM